MSEPDCTEALHRIYHYLDEEGLTDEVRARIARHLDECPPCKDGYDFERELRALIADKCREEVPEALRRRIAEAIGHEELHHQPAE
ncbi:MAG: mycothiol system anti-sigma-R factor [Acidimicrobiia bacterium]